MRTGEACDTDIIILCCRLCSQQTTHQRPASQEQVNYNPIMGRSITSEGPERVFVCSLFNEVINNSNYIASYNWMEVNS
jgi:hypothetical protein